MPQPAATSQITASMAGIRVRTSIRSGATRNVSKKPTVLITSSFDGLDDIEPPVYDAYKERMYYGNI